MHQLSLGDYVGRSSLGRCLFKALRKKKMMRKSNQEKKGLTPDGVLTRVCDIGIFKSLFFIYRRICTSMSRRAARGFFFSSSIWIIAYCNFCTYLPRYVHSLVCIANQVSPSALKQINRNQNTKHYKTNDCQALSSTISLFVYPFTLLCLDSSRVSCQRIRLSSKPLNSVSASGMGLE